MEVRWLIRRDLPRVLEIEQASFEYPWSEDDFLCVLRQRHCIGLVAVEYKQVAGFIIYQLEEGVLDILNLAVCPSQRRHGIGAAIVERMRLKMAQQRRSALRANVRETNLPAQIFFRSQGFLAEQVIRNFYDDTDEDCYEFVYTARERVAT